MSLVNTPNCERNKKMSLLFASHFTFWDFSMFKILTVKLYKDDPTIWQAPMLNILAVHRLLDQNGPQNRIEKSGFYGFSRTQFFFRLSAISVPFSAKFYFKKITKCYQTLPNVTKAYKIYQMLPNFYNFLQNFTNFLTNLWFKHFYRNFKLL